jgi:hypothetical protein
MGTFEESGPILNCKSNILILKVKVRVPRHLQEVSNLRQSQWKRTVVSVALQIRFHGNIPIRGHHKLQILCFLRNGFDFQTGSPGNTLQFISHIPQIYFEMGSMLTSPTLSVCHVLIKMEWQNKADVRRAIGTDDLAMWRLHLQITLMSNKDDRITGSTFWQATESTEMLWMTIRLQIIIGCM